MTTTDSQSVPPLPKLRWYQYSLRTLLLFVLLCSLLCSWFATRATNQRDAVCAIRSISGCEVSYDCDPRRVFDPDIKLIVAVMEGKPPPPAPKATWTERLLGRDFAHRAVSVGVPLAQVHAVLPHLKHLPCLQSVYVLQPDKGSEAETQAAVDQIEQEVPGIAVIALLIDYDLNESVKPLKAGTRGRK